MKPPHGTTMNPVSEIGLIVGREVRRNARSWKGITLLALSLLGGGALATIYTFLERLKKEHLPPDVTAEMIRQAREDGLSKVYGDGVMAKHLSGAPEVLWIVLMLTIWLTPLLVSILGFDSVAGDTQHRSVRFWAARARKESVFLGKFFGLWFTVVSVTFLMHFVVWLVVALMGNIPAATVFSWGAGFWLCVVPIAGAWSALATFLSSLFRTPMVALLTTCATFFVIFFVKLVGDIARFEPITWIYPNKYDNLLLSPEPRAVALGVGGLLLFALVFGGSGATLFARKDV